MSLLRIALMAPCVAALMAGAAVAQDVKSYSAPPSVEELKSVLGGGSAGQKVKFRKLEFGDEGAASPPPAADRPSTAAPSYAAPAPSSYTPPPAQSNSYAPPPKQASSGGSSYSAASTPSGQAGNAVSFPINFAYNSANIDPVSRPFIDAIGQLLAQQPEMQIVVEGHTDAAGSDYYNQDLSQRRAVSVKNYLISRFGIEPQRLIAIGKGEADPLIRQDPYNPQNRRVQFRVTG